MAKSKIVKYEKIKYENKIKTYKKIILTKSKIVKYKKIKYENKFETKSYSNNNIQIYKCHCGFAFINKKQLNMHDQNCAIYQDKKMYQCKCGAKYNMLFRLNYHKQFFCKYDN